MKKSSWSRKVRAFFSGTRGLVVLASTAVVLGGLTGGLHALNQGAGDIITEPLKIQPEQRTKTRDKKPTGKSFAPLSTESELEDNRSEPATPTEEAPVILDSSPTDDMAPNPTPEPQPTQPPRPAPPESEEVAPAAPAPDPKPTDEPPTDPAPPNSEPDTESPDQSTPPIAQ